MADFSSINVESIVSNCSDNAAAIAESLNQCFDTQHELTVSEAVNWSVDEAPEELEGPGLLVTCRVGGDALVCAIPASLPLPDWYTDPGDSQSARLETLAMEWSMNLLPGDLECDEYSTTAHPNLLAAIPRPAPDVSATILPFAIDGGKGQLWALWPVPAPAQTAQAAGGSSQDDPATPPPTPAQTPPAPVDRLARLRNIPVPVIVKLAERRIEIEELLRLCPGTIVSFDKPCEDLLELMVNNRIYALGEAVKIGEKFGLKVSEVGYTPHREPRVLS